VGRQELQAGAALFYSAASIASGRALINATSRASSSADNADRGNVACFRGSIEPVCRSPLD